MMKIIITALMSLMFVATAQAADFHVGEYTNGEAYIYMNGGIEEGDLKKLKKAYGDSRIAPTGFQIQLNSPGGLKPEAIAMAEWLREKKAVTVVHNGQSCYSGCAIMWAYGAEKFISENAKALGFHMSFNMITPESVEWFDAYQSGFGWSGIQGYFKENMKEDLEYYANMPVAQPAMFALNIAIDGAHADTFWYVNRQNAWIIGNVQWF